MNEGPGGDHAAWALGLRDLLERAHDRDAARYRDVWVPYMQGFPHHWVRPLWSLNRPEELERAATLGPHATHHLEVSGWFLDDTFGRLGVYGARELATNPHMSVVSSLDLESMLIRHKGVEALGASPYTTQLTQLDLTGNDLGKQAMMALAMATSFDRVCAINLSQNQLDDDSITLLEHTRFAENLRSLSVAYNRNLTPAAIEFLAHAPFLSGLEHLDIGWTQLGDDAALALAASTTLTNLKSLGLYWAGLSAVGVEALLHAPIASTLEHLDIRSNGLSADVATGLISSSDTLRPDAKILFSYQA